MQAAAAARTRTAFIGAAAARGRSAIKYTHTSHHLLLDQTAAGEEGGRGGLEDDALGAGRVGCVADAQLSTASAGMSKTRLVHGGGHAGTAFC